MLKHTVKVTFANGDSITTWINGTEAEVRAYYAIGKLFNVGLGPHDNMQAVASLEFINE